MKVTTPKSQIKEFFSKSYTDTIFSHEESYNCPKKLKKKPKPKKLQLIAICCMSQLFHSIKSLPSFLTSIHSSSIWRGIFPSQELRLFFPVPTKLLNLSAAPQKPSSPTSPPLSLSSLTELGTALVSIGTVKSDFSNEPAACTKRVDAFSISTLVYQSPQSEATAYKGHWSRYQA